MSLLARLERRDISGFGGWPEYLDGRIPPPGADAVSSAGQLVTERTALGLIDAYACISLISDSISMLPLGAYRRTADYRVPIEPAPPLVAQPDLQFREASQFWAAATTSLLTAGNVYAPVVSRDRLGYPTAVEIQHPNDVHVRWRRDRRKREFRMRGGGTVADADMLWVPWVLLPGAPQGLSPIQTCRRGLGLAIATEEFGARWFGEGAAPSSVFESDENPDPAEVRRTMARWVATHGGRRRPAFVGGGLKYKPISIPPNESQFLETRGMNTPAICRLFGRVPPHMIGDVDRSTSWGTGIENMGIGFVVYTLGPVLTRFERLLSVSMPRSQYAKFTVTALLRGNTRDRFYAYAVGRQWGWLSVNDIRRLEDLPPIGPEGDVYLQPLAYTDAEAALAALNADKLTPKTPEPELVPAPTGGAV